MKKAKTPADRATARLAKAERRLAKAEARLQKTEAKLETRKAKVAQARSDHQAALAEAEQHGASPPAGTKSAADAPSAPDTTRE